MGDLAITRTQYLELENLALGALHPLDGFMNEDQFRGVVDHMRLPDGMVFTLPVVLDTTRDRAAGIAGLPSVRLWFDGVEVGEVVPESIYECDKREVVRKVFGTDDAAHPGVSHFFSMGDVFVGGPVRLMKRTRPDVSAEELTPRATRAAFAARGWRTVAGFQTRNVPHRAHEYLQRIALEQVDGLFIQPLIGRRKEGDYTPQAILTGYRALIAGFYPRDRVMLGALTTAMRYAGPREAVLHAIIRRNYGCTHFIVGRDHAGVGNYYGKYDAHDLVQRFDDELGIAILCMAGPYYCTLCGGIVTERTCPHGVSRPDAVMDIAGTDIRAILVGGAEPDTRIMRSEVLESLRGVPLFIEETEL